MPQRGQANLADILEGEERTGTDIVTAFATLVESRKLLPEFTAKLKKTGILGRPMGRSNVRRHTSWAISLRH